MPTMVPVPAVPRASSAAPRLSLGSLSTVAFWTGAAARFTTRMNLSSSPTAWSVRPAARWCGRRPSGRSHAPGVGALELGLDRRRALFDTPNSVRTTCQGSAGRTPCGNEGGDPRGGVGAGAGERPRRAVAARPGPHRRHAAAVAVQLLRLEERHLRRHVRAGRAAVRGRAEGVDADCPTSRSRRSRPSLHFFVEFCAADFARYQLLFQRTIPGFEPSPESFKISEDNLAELGELLARCGVTDPEALDLFTALGTGLDRPAAVERSGRRSLDPADRRRRRDVLRAHHQEGEASRRREGERDDDRDTASRRSRRSRGQEVEGLGADRVRAGRRPAPLARPGRLGEADRLPAVGRAGDGGSQHRHAGDLHGLPDPDARDERGATKAAKRSGGPMVDALTAKQVADHADLSTSELIAKVDEVGPRAARVAGDEARAVPQNADEGGGRRRAGDVAHGLPARRHPHP